jgi:hypothetical protein
MSVNAKRKQEIECNKDPANIPNHLPTPRRKIRYKAIGRKHNWNRDLLEKINPIQTGAICCSIIKGGRIGIMLVKSKKSSRIPAQNPPITHFRFKDIFKIIKDLRFST